MTVRSMPFAALFLALAFVVPTSAHADDAAKEKLARELMSVTGSADLGKQMIEGMTAQFAAQPGVPGDFVRKFVELADPNDLIEMVVPLYVKTFDVDTLQAAVEFYKSPAGKKLVGALPMITQESMVLGQQWGMDLATRAQAAVEAEQGK